jgi:N-acetylneuraminic acid mutarotase
MRSRSVSIGLILLVAAGLPACGEDATEPSRAVEPSPTAPSLAIASNRWITRANMPWNRTDVTTATVTSAAGRSVVYAIGGLNPYRTPQQTVTAYDVATNTWTFRRPLPVRLAGTNGAGVVNGKIYVSGGFSDYKQAFPTAALYMYNPATNTWTRKRDMPSLRAITGEQWEVGAQGETAVIKGKLYVLSACYVENAPWGYDEGCPSGPWFFRYNPGTDTWTTLPSPGSAMGTLFRSPFQGGVIDGKFYVMGAASPYDHDGAFALYDPATNQWTKLTTGFALERPWAATAVLDGNLYVMGGLRYNVATDVMDTLAVTVRYDPATGRWLRLADLPGPRWGIAASTVFLNGNARIEVLGGSGTGNNLQYTP